MVYFLPFLTGHENGVFSKENGKFQNKSGNSFDRISFARFKR